MVFEEYGVGGYGHSKIGVYSGNGLIPLELTHLVLLFSLGMPLTR